MTIPSVARSDHHGVPVFTSPVQTTFTGTLTFAVGMRDEAARFAGLTHLVEHLVMLRVGKVAITHNASTEEDRVSFFARGRADAVGEFMNRVAASIRTIAEVTAEEVEQQHDVIEAEMGEGSNMAGFGPLLDRFGAHTLGLLDLRSPAHRSLTRQDAVEWAQTWLHAGNAVFTFTGPMPENLDAPLPEARPLPQRRPVEALPFRTTGWVPGNPSGTALAMFLRTQDRVLGAVTGNVISRALHQHLRDERSLIYSVQPFASRVDETTLYDANLLDPSPENTVEAVTEALRMLRSLATDGVPGELLRSVAEEYGHQIEESEVQAAFLNDYAYATTRWGAQLPGLEAFSPDAVAPEAIAQLIGDSLPSMLVSAGMIAGDHTPESVSEAWELELSDFPSPRYGNMNRRQMFAEFMKDEVQIFDPKWFKGLKGQQLIIDPRQVSMTFEGGLLEMPFEDIVLAGRCDEHGHWALNSSNGLAMIVDPSQWRKGRAIDEALATRVPAVARYVIDEGENLAP